MIVGEPGVFVPAALTGRVAVLLGESVRRRGLVDAEVCRLIDELALVGRAVAAVAGSVGTGPEPFSVPSLGVGRSVVQAAEVLGISERAVRKRIASGALSARLVRGRWEIIDANVV